MSAQVAISPTAPARDSRPWISIALAGLILVAVIAMAALHLLVNMTNSREGQALFPSVVQPGDTVSGEVYLTNGGLLPLTYSLQPREAAGNTLPPHLLLTVRRLDDGAYLYRGPLDTTPDLALINPGQKTHLRVSISAEDSTEAAAIPIPITYYWPARPTLPWWWVLAALGLLVALLGFGFYRRGRTG
jgi:hypothetical protein